MNEKKSNIYDNLTFARQLPCNCLMTASHSRFRHYFYSNLYEHILRGVKKSDFFLQIKLLSFCARIAPKRHKIPKSSKCQKNVKKILVFLEYFKYSSIWGQYYRTKPQMVCLVDPGASFDTPGVILNYGKHCT